jgi:2-(3-amino-3-carboxypropyl)histidine synthase
VGSGNFHALGAAIVTGKPVVVADPYINEVREIGKEKERMLRQRFGAVERAKEAFRFGILISLKPGQTRLDLALSLSKLIKMHGKAAHELAMHSITPDKLKSFKCDAFVSTACPRIALDDYLMYDVPIITPKELEIVLGEISWDEYTMDEML